MAHHVANPTPNLLLQALSPTDWDRVAPLLTRVPIALHQSLESGNERIEHADFPEYGLASIVGVALNGHRNEVGLLGHDGMTGGSIVLGDTQSPFDCMGQLEGAALRISAEDLEIVLEESISLRKTLISFARSLAIQTAFTTVANSQTHVDQRLARWLLMVHDRVTGDTFEITHEYLSVMLGVRRPGVTDAMHILEGRLFIASSRNKVVIKDRYGLIEHSGGSYGSAEREYTRITGIKLAKSMPSAKRRSGPTTAEACH